ncbi:hypothetical protein CMI37_02695 [Candidatus Pacearchaeota archaeon]|nr:hypothetical protein [Candidatus Pacearchaeota archaeon]
MAISEKTKEVVFQQREALQHRYDNNLADIEGHKADIAGLEATNKNLKSEIDALKKDIPVPKPE